MRDTSGLIDTLVRDLARVKPLPALRRVAGGLLAVIAALLALVFAVQLAMDLPLIKSGFGRADVLGSVGHGILAAGALAVALASCVPGREALVRAGLGIGVVGVALTGAAIAGLPASSTRGAVDPLWWSATTSCLLLASLPALVPALLLARFATRGLPRRPLATLGFGALAALGFATLPGQLGCPSTDLLHRLFGHQLAPLVGAVFVTGVAGSAFYALRERARANS